MSTAAPFNPRTREIIVTLADVLGASVALCDLEQARVHEWRSVVRGEALVREWCVRRGDASLLDVRGHCHAMAAVNDRWTLVVSKRGFLHPDVAALVEWGSKLLRGELLGLRAEGTSFPPAGGGGSSGGSAELGIPLWWAQKSHGAGELALLRGR
jgi:hypothetical protein